MPSASRPAQPNREYHQAMSSVCTTAEPGTAFWSRPASVVLPPELRPSTARTTGQRLPARWRPRRIRPSATAASGSTRQGPASGSPARRCNGRCTGGTPVEPLSAAAQVPVRRLDVGRCLSVADLPVVVEDAVGFPVTLAGRVSKDVAVRQAFDGYLDQPGIRCREDRAIPGAADEDRV